MKKIISFGIIIILIISQLGTIVAEVTGIPEEESLIVSESDPNLADWIAAGKDVVISDDIQDAIDEQNAAIKDALMTYGGKTDAEINLYFQFDISGVDEDVYRQYGIIVKGNSVGGIPQIDAVAYPVAAGLQAVDADGDYRLLGMNINNEWVENPFYDPTPNSDIDKRDWLYREDNTNIANSVIGNIITPTGIFDYDGLVDQYYINFVFGFYEDYFAFLSSDYYSEYNTAWNLYTNDFLAGLFDLFNLDLGYYLFNTVGYRGSVNAPKVSSASDMGSYLKMVVLPTEHSAGVSYMFHKTASGTVYYISSFMYSGGGVDGRLKTGLTSGITADIDVPSPISDTTTSVPGTFEFDISGTAELVSYEIFNVSSGTTINETLTGTIGGGLTSYSRTVPITVNVPGSSQSVSISIRATDIDGNIDETTATANIVKSVTISTSSLSANGTAVVMADDRGSEEFDVLQGIPTTEDLYANVTVDEYLFEENYIPVTGSLTYTVTVKRDYNKSWTDASGISHSDTDTRTKVYTITKNYIYYVIDYFNVYELNEATLNSTVFSGGGINIAASGYTAPSISTTVYTDHITDPHPSGTITKTLADKNISGGNSEPATPDPDWSTKALNATGDLDVRNDLVVFDGTVVMDDTWTADAAPTPSNSLISPQIGINVLYEDDLTIPMTTENGTYGVTGTVTYERIPTSHDSTMTTITDSLAGINDVTVHSPVVCYPSILFDMTYNQVIDLDTTKANAVIDQNFRIQIPNNGQHKSIPGYGNRDYEEYIGAKQIKPTCDLYLMNGNTVSAYIKANEWYSLSVPTETYEFRVPHWVEENDYTLLFRNLANNTPAVFTGLYQLNQNSNLVNYSAVEAINIVVVGQMYDFKITGSTESNYDNMFFLSDGSNTGLEYFTGDQNHQGDVDSTHINTIPIMPGKNTTFGFDKHVLKKGSAFFYSVNTNGNMVDEEDFVIARPKFYYVDYSGLNKQEVDIWYEDNGLKQLGTTHKYTINMSLNNKYTNVSDTDINNTSEQYFNDYYTGGVRTLSNYQLWYREDESKKSKKIGSGLSNTLDYEQRIYVGDTSVPAGVDRDDALKGVQEYKGAYYIPRTARALPKGDTDLDHELKNGYIIVNFDIYTIDNFDGINTTDYHLSYDTAAADMFSIENYNNTQNGFSLNTGDIVFYDLNKSASEDFTTQGIY